ncbi:MAG: UDP-N-acetylmuramate dehydrogenase [Peptococcaceae bacterium]|nr:UDP-N-acetylmuramate dehydrogenase [Peptococcaceae bacterium]
MDWPQVKGRLEKDYPLKTLCTWKIGGLGKIVYWPQEQEDLVQVVQWCRAQKKPFVLLGRGSNVLLPDEGLNCLVIVSTELKNISWLENTVQVEAGYPLMLLARECAKRSLQGLEFAAGIPGTVGGALAINAGAYGGEIGCLVKEVTVLTPEGKRIVLPGEKITFGYRYSSLQANQYYILESTFELQVNDSKILLERIREFNSKRKNTQPLEYPNAGSVFRNPQGHSAARLIEAAGWKGYRVGGAQVSEKHANFIVNRGDAKAAEVRELIQLIQKDIFDKFGIKLQTEVKMY